jgi:alkylation response protein AidB-like acyl-CoA dehydrogenase
MKESGKFFQHRHSVACFSKDFPVERYYRDAPLLVIGGGTNELQRLIIARQLLEKYAIR